MRCELSKGSPAETIYPEEMGCIQNYGWKVEIGDFTERIYKYCCQHQMEKSRWVAVVVQNFPPSTHAHSVLMLGSSMQGIFLLNLSCSQCHYRLMDISGASVGVVIYASQFFYVQIFHMEISALSPISSVPKYSRSFFFRVSDIWHWHFCANICKWLFVILEVQFHQEGGLTCSQCRILSSP